MTSSSFNITLLLLSMLYIIVLGKPETVAEHKFKFKYPKFKYPKLPLAATRPLSVGCGAFAVHLITRGHLPFRCSTVKAAAVVGLISASTFPQHAAAVYTGAFAGMTTNAFIRNRIGYSSLVATSVLSLEFWERAKLFEGYGGRFGTAAACAGWICVQGHEIWNAFQSRNILLYFQQTVRTLWIGQGLGKYISLGHFIPLFPDTISKVSIVFLAAMSTSYLKEKSKNPVQASALISLIGAVALEHVNTHLPGLVMIGSFLGNGRVLNAGGSTPLKVTVLQCILAVIFSSTLNNASLLHQVGGRLGASAFLSIIMTKALVGATDSSQESAEKID